MRLSLEGAPLRFVGVDKVRGALSFKFSLTEEFEVLIPLNALIFNVYLLSKEPARGFNDWSFAHHDYVKWLQLLSRANLEGNLPEDVFAFPTYLNSFSELTRDSQWNSSDIVALLVPHPITADLIAERGRLSGGPALFSLKERKGPVFDVRSAEELIALLKELRSSRLRGVIILRAMELKYSHASLIRELRKASDDLGVRFVVITDNVNLALASDKSFAVAGLSVKALRNLLRGLRIRGSSSLKVLLPELKEFLRELFRAPLNRFTLAFPEIIAIISAISLGYRLNGGDLRVLPPLKPALIRIAYQLTPSPYRERLLQRALANLKLTAYRDLVEYVRVKRMEMREHEEDDHQGNELLWSLLVREDEKFVWLSLLMSELSEEDLSSVIEMLIEQVRSGLSSEDILALIVATVSIMATSGYRGSEALLAQLLSAIEASEALSPSDKFSAVAALYTSLRGEEAQLMVERLKLVRILSELLRGMSEEEKLLQLYKLSMLPPSEEAISVELAVKLEDVIANGESRLDDGDVIRLIATDVKKLSHLLLSNALLLPYKERTVAYMLTNRVLNSLDERSRRNAVNLLMDAVEVEENLYLRGILSLMVSRCWDLLSERLAQIALSEPHPILASLLLSAYIALNLEANLSRLRKLIGKLLAEDSQETVRLDVLGEEVLRDFKEIVLEERDFKDSITGALRKLLGVMYFLSALRLPLFKLLLEFLELIEISGEETVAFLKELPLEELRESLVALIRQMSDEKLKISTRQRYLLLTLIESTRLSLDLSLLATFLRDEDPLIRSRAVRIMAYSEPELVSEIIDYLLEDSSSRVRVEAMRLVGKLKLERYVDKLKEIYRSAETLQEKLAALEGLAPFAEYLRELFLEAVRSPNREIRQLALRVLRSLGSGVPESLLFMLPELPPEAREDVIETLIVLGYHVVKPALEVLRSKPWELGGYVEELIYRLSSDLSLKEVLLRELWDTLSSGSESPVVKHTLIKILGRLRSKQLLKVLDELSCEDCESALRYALDFFSFNELHESYIRRVELPTVLDLKVERTVMKYVNFLRVLRLFSSSPSRREEDLRTVKRLLLEGMYLPVKGFNLTIVINELLTYRTSSYREAHYRLILECISLMNKLELKDVAKRYASGMVTLLSYQPEEESHTLIQARAAFTELATRLGLTEVFPKIAKWLTSLKGRHAYELLESLRAAPAENSQHLMELIIAALQEELLRRAHDEEGVASLRERFQLLLHILSTSENLGGILARLDTCKVLEECFFSLHEDDLKLELVRLIGACARHGLRGAAEFLRKVISGGSSESFSSVAREILSDLEGDYGEA